MGWQQFEEGTKKSTLLCAIGLVGLAAPAGAATLSISADKASYNIGETITLTLIGTSTSGEQAKSVFAAVGYSAALTQTVSASQQPHTTSFGMNTWTQGALQTSDGEADLLNQIAGLSASSNGSGTSMATAKLVMQAAGIVTVQFLNESSLGGKLDYFGITDASQTTGTSFGWVPEPGAVSLVGLGLIALAARGRRRRT